MDTATIATGQVPPAPPPPPPAITSCLATTDNIDVLKYQIEALKDEYEELEENYHKCQKDFKNKSRQHDALNRDLSQLEQESKRHLAVKDNEIARMQAQILRLEQELEQYKQSLEEARKAEQERVANAVPTNVVVSCQQQMDAVSAINAAVAAAAAPGEQSQLITNELLTSPEKLLEFYRDSSKQTREFQYKAKKAEQECAVLQTNVTRLENQITRFKQSLKEAEDVEDELKAEKRKLLRELREAQAKVDELETTNSHLQKRIDKMRSRNLANAVPSATTTSTINNQPQSSSSASSQGTPSLN